MTPRKLPTGPRFAEQLLLDAAVEIQQDPDATEAAFMARHLVQCTLPHSDPGDIRQWTRTNGTFTLRIRPNFDRVTDRALFPYGSIPRLLLFWIVTEAKQKKSRQLRLGRSLDSFMREVGLNPRTGGGKRSDAKRLRDQMARLFRATISFEDSRIGHDRWVDMQVAPEGELWWTPGRATQDTLWESWIELGERFYESITNSAVPVDLRALRALKRSPLALDLYAWLTYTAYVATKNRAPRVVPWKGLHGQMGAEYAQLRDFRIKVALALKKIKLVYPALKVELTPASMIVHPSATAIADRQDDSASTKQLSARSRTVTINEAADVVMAGCGFAERSLFQPICETIKVRTAASETTALEAAESMVSSWREYQELGTLLRFRWRPERFFTEGHWAAPATWPIDREKVASVRNSTVGIRRN